MYIINECSSAVPLITSEGLQQNQTKMNQFKLQSISDFPVNRALLNVAAVTVSQRSWVIRSNQTLEQQTLT